MRFNRRLLVHLSLQLSNFLDAFKSAATATFLFLALPLGVFIIGILIIYRQRKRNRSVVLPIIAAVAAEAAALVPFIGVAFFSKDNVLYLAIMPLCFAFTIGVLLPLIIPIICALIRWTMKRKDVRITKGFYITSAAFEIISAVVSVLIITKDVYVP